MAHTISQQQTYLIREKTSRPFVFYRFFDWAAKQDEKNHVGWVGASVMLMAGVIFPATLAIILLNGAEFSLVMAAMSSLILVVVANLAALPTKYTIPFLVLGTVADLAIIISSFFMK